jgi:hypothetical protein
MCLCGIADLKEVILVKFLCGIADLKEVILVTCSCGIAAFKGSYSSYVFMWNC